LFLGYKAQYVSRVVRERSGRKYSQAAEKVVGEGQQRTINFRSGKSSLSKEGRIVKYREIALETSLVLSTGCERDIVKVSW